MGPNGAQSRMCWRCFVAALGACVLMALPRTVCASQLAVSLSVARDRLALDCPERAELGRQVESIVQRPLGEGSRLAEPIQVRVRFSREHGSYVARLRFRGPKPGERVLRDRGASCAALSQAVSVAIALLIDSELQAREEGSDAAVPTRKGPAKASTAPVPGRLPAETTAPAPSSESGKLELWASLGAGAAFGVISQTAVSVGQSFGLRLSQGWIFELGLGALLPQSQRFGSGEIRSSLLMASARGCYAFGQRFSLSPCVRFGLGRLRATGSGYSEVSTADLLWTAIGPGVLAEAPVWGPVFLGISGDLWVVPRQLSLSVENEGIAWESAPIAGSLAARVALRIW